MKISYCTTCHNRLWQLKQTIYKNLNFTKVNEVELCVLAYNDKTVLPWLEQNFPKHIADGRLKIGEHYDNYQPFDGSNFACGYVKNFSHAMAKGQILFNLDADNFIDNAHEYLLALKENEVLKNVCSTADGRSGRIGVYKTVFDKIGGYQDVGRSDDGDFVLRCLRQGIKLKQMDCNLAPIGNDIEVN